MRFGLDVSQHQLTWQQVRDRTLFAENAGFDGAWVFDHFKPLYGDPSGPCMEGWTLLGALAVATEKIRLGTLVTGITYRHPSLLVTQAATLDVISGGRLEMAVGAAWYESEHREFGVPFPRPKERIERLEDFVAAYKALTTSDGTSMNGHGLELRDATYNPKPVQHPHPPLWIGANGEKKMIPLAARVADVWHGSGDLEILQRKNRLIDTEAERVGRSPSDIERATWLSISEPIDQIERRVDALQDIGMDYLTVSWPEQGRTKVEQFVKRVLDLGP